MSTMTTRTMSAAQAFHMSLSQRIGRRTKEKTRTIRSYIPKSIEPTDKPVEIMDVFNVSYGTACVWLRILRGPVKRN
jgi:hypothetical protein